MSRARYVLFLGCQIPARHPFTEKSLRVALPRLGVEFAEVDGFTCCPERTLIETMDEKVWLLAAARNLAVAERAAEVLITPCNGCYSTLKLVSNRLRSEPALRERINRLLARVDLQYQGRLVVRHIVDLLYTDVGVRRLSQAVVKPLRGLRIGVHPGCHQTRPSLGVGFDDPLNPVKLEALVRALGAEVVDYSTKMLCCGQYLGGVGDAEDATAFVRRKLSELVSLGADALTTTCPQCFVQYDTTQSLLERRGERLHLPVFSYPELLALALGFSREELGVDRHRTDPTSFFARWGTIQDGWSIIERYLPREFVQHCADCGACDRLCPVQQHRPSFRPNELIRRVAAGELEAVLREEEFWHCIDCHTCYEMCPQRFGMERVFLMLKHIAMERGAVPKGIERAVGEFLKSGRLIAPDERARQSLGMGKLPADGRAELLRLLAELQKEEQRS
ncbi:MAG: heterodisulfide reductase-related iron-sulfur binding cluster [Bacillota bacterium]|nr:heterodisulfide reductase-related iron-sulfur binding cluster [Bacillota bacterium]